MRIRKGDTVIVISGREKGRSGEVQMVYSALQRVVISGINIQTKHKKPSGTRQVGGREKREAPIHISNVMPIRTGSKNKGTRVGYTIDKHGVKIRTARQAHNKEIK